MSKEQPTSSVSGVPVEDPAPVSLLVDCEFGSIPMDSNLWKKRKGLHDVVVDAVPLQELGTEDYGNTKDAFLVDLAVLEAGVTQVWGKYGIIKFIPLSSDDPIVLQQSAKDLDLKKALCYQHLRSKYVYKGNRTKELAAVLGYEMNKGLTD
ncbi:uncharacterized protein N7479_001642 [Penicillium vulpinum]|nr:uncharacterized protein N7479_001642 [Penicillium vulpinum]KAJ5971724.1 hypothetical protein N7479_001642 [Penicillium vulpinum]